VSRRNGGAHREGLAEFFEGALGAHAGGVFGEAELAADLGVGVAGEVAQEDGLAVGLTEGREGVVEEGFDAGPVGGRFGGGGGGGGGHRRVNGERGVGGGECFAGRAAGIGLAMAGGGVSGCLIQPAGETGVASEGGRFAREAEEDYLRHFLGAVVVAIELAAGGGVNEVGVAANQLGEGGLVAVAGVAVEQVGIGHGGFIRGYPRRRQNRTGEAGNSLLGLRSSAAEDCQLPWLASFAGRAKTRLRRVDRPASACRPLAASWPGFQDSGKARLNNTAGG
jgi:hypothetical protein